MNPSINTSSRLIAGAMNIGQSTVNYARGNPSDKAKLNSMFFGTPPKKADGADGVKGWDVAKNVLMLGAKALPPVMLVRVLANMIGKQFEKKGAEKNQDSSASLSTSESKRSSIDEEENTVQQDLKELNKQKEELEKVLKESDHNLEPKTKKEELEQAVKVAVKDINQLKLSVVNAKMQLLGAKSEHAKQTMQEQIEELEGKIHIKTNFLKYDELDLKHFNERNNTPVDSPLKNIASNEDNVTQVKSNVQQHQSSPNSDPVPQYDDLDDIMNTLELPKVNNLAQREIEIPPKDKIDEAAEEVHEAAKSVGEAPIELHEKANENVEPTAHGKVEETVQEKTARLKAQAVRKAQELVFEAQEANKEMARITDQAMPSIRSEISKIKSEMSKLKPGESNLILKQQLEAAQSEQGKLFKNFAEAKQKFDNNMSNVFKIDAALKAVEEDKQ